MYELAYYSVNALKRYTRLSAVQCVTTPVQRATVHYSVVHCTAHCSSLHHTVPMLYRTVPLLPVYTALYRIVPHYTDVVLQRTTLYRCCTALYWHCTLTVQVFFSKHSNGHIGLPFECLNVSRNITPCISFECVDRIICNFRQFEIGISYSI